jgi:adenosylcobyric acid synthase
VADVSFVRRTAELDAELVVLPGSKNVGADRRWLRERGFDEPLRAHVAAGRRLIGICGGLQLLGETFEDDCGDGSDRGLGLLPLETRFAAAKTVRRRRATFLPLPEPWSALSRLRVSGYEIRHGSSAATGPLRKALRSDLGFVAGPILAVYLHGLLEQTAVLAALFGATPELGLEETFDRLADAVDEHLDMKAVTAAAGLET